jgi:hypothetical protein
LQLRLHVQMKMPMFLPEEASGASGSIANQNQVVVCFSFLAAVLRHWSARRVIQPTPTMLTQ